MQPLSSPIDWQVTYAAIWRERRQALRAVRNTDPVALTDLLGIDRQKRLLLENTERFIAKLPANHALLWGARGTGKSSLVKAVFNAHRDQGLRLIEIDKDDLLALAEIVDHVRDLPQRFILFCDDLSFEAGDGTFKALKSVLEGSVELPPENVLLYATSNRRHLMPEFMSDNEDTQHTGGELHFSDAVEEKLSLSDRFGLCLSFYSVNQDDYLAMIDNYFGAYAGDRTQLHQLALRFALQKGGRSGRTAKQFYNTYFAKTL